MPNLSRSKTIWKDDPRAPKTEFALGQKQRDLGWRLASESRPEGCRLIGVRKVLHEDAYIKLYRWIRVL
jgi:hypothetical protein